MATEKRERQRANRQRKVEEKQRETKKAGLRRRIIVISAVTVFILGALFLYSRSGDDDPVIDTTAPLVPPEDSTDDSDATDDDGTDTGTPDEDVTDQETDDGGTDEGAVEPAPDEDAEARPDGPVDPVCPPADGATTRTVQFTEAPPMCLEDGVTYTAEVVTSMGSFTIELDAEAAPLTVNNFVFLARHRFYDGVAFHRVIADFVIQGGDAVGDPPGTGGPGYRFDDELPAVGAYQLGSVAMANSGANTNGSQFFVIIGPRGVALPPDYSLFGQVIDGLDVATAISEVATDSADAPLDPVIITSITVNES